MCQAKHGLLRAIDSLRGGYHWKEISPDDRRHRGRNQGSGAQLLQVRTSGSLPGGGVQAATGQEKERQQSVAQGID